MKVAVLGLGSIGRRHAGNLLAEGCRVVGYDPSAEARAELTGLGGVAAESRAAALDGAEAVVIASPNAFHLDDMRAGLDAGCHLFVEKPLAHSERGVEALLERAAAAGRIVFAALNLRYHPAVQAARALRPDMGAPLWGRLLAASYLPDWRPGRDHRLNYAADRRTGGVLFDVLHEFDLANHLLGPAQTLAAAARSTGSIGITSDDCADVILLHESGVQSALHLDYVTRPPVRVVDLALDGGRLCIDIRKRRLTAWGVDGTTLADRQFEGSPADDYVTEIRAFLACLRGESEPACDGREALSVLRQVIAARRLCGLEEAA
ncbi:MAG: Gfo/Idh/MocA family protein [Kiloniellales bacterium]